MVRGLEVVQEPAIKKMRASFQEAGTCISKLESGLL
jgi:hypothetical protein